MAMRSTSPDPEGGPDLPYIHQQLQEAQAAARSLYELFPDPAAVAPLYQALLHALVEINREIGAMRPG